MNFKIVFFLPLNTNLDFLRESSNNPEESSNLSFRSFIAYEDLTKPFYLNHCYFLKGEFCFQK